MSPLLLELILMYTTLVGPFGIGIAVVQYLALCVAAGRTL